MQVVSCIFCTFGITYKNLDKKIEIAAQLGTPPKQQIFTKFGKVNLNSRMARHSYLDYKGVYSIEDIPEKSENLSLGLLILLVVKTINFISEIMWDPVVDPVEKPLGSNGLFIIIITAIISIIFIMIIIIAIIVTIIITIIINIIIVIIFIIIIILTFLLCLY